MYQYQLLGMAYVGEELHMYVLLPKQKFGLNSLLAKIDVTELLALIEFNKTHEVEVNSKILVKFYDFFF